MRRAAPYLLFAVAALVLTVSWTRPGAIRGGGDDGLIFANPKKIFAQGLSLWSEANAPGNISWNGTTALPIFVPLGLLQLAGIPPWFLQALYTFAILFIGQFATFLFLRALLPDRPRAALLAAFFYLANTFTFIQVFFRGFLAIEVAFAAFPLTLALYTLALRTGQSAYALGAGLATALFAAAFSHPAILALFGLAIIILTLFATFREGQAGWKRALSLFVIFIASSLLFGAYWIIPYTIAITQLQHSEQLTGMGVAANVLNALAAARDSTIPNLLRLFHPYLTADRFQFLAFEAASPFSGYYNQPFILVLFWLPALLALLAIVIRRKRVAILALLALLGLFLAKGAAPPGTSLVVWIFENIPLAGIFRDPYQKIGLLYVLPLAGLVGVGTDALAEWVGRRAKLLGHAIPLAFVTGAVVLTLPMWRGTFWDRPGVTFVQVPGEYLEVNNLVSRLDPRSPILHLPSDSGFLRRLAWDPPYTGSSPYPVLFSPPSLSGKVAQLAADRLVRELTWSLPFVPIEKVAALLGVRFIIIHDDFVPFEREHLPPAQLRNILNSFLRATEGPKLCCSGQTVVKSLRPGAPPPDLLPKAEGSAERRIRLSEHAYGEGGSGGQVGLRLALPPPLRNLLEFPLLEIELTSSADADAILILKDGRGGEIEWQPIPLERNRTNRRLLSRSHFPAIVKTSFDPSDIRDIELRLINLPPNAPVSLTVDSLKARGQSAVAQSGFETHGRLRSLEVVEVSSERRRPPIAAVTSIVPVGSTADVFRRLPEVDPRIEAFVFEEDVARLRLAAGSPPTIKVEESRPGRLLIKVVGAETPFLLLTNISFNPGWQAKLAGRELAHFLANGYANAWYIDKLGTYEVEVQFWPDRLVHLAFGISFASLLIALGWLLRQRSGRIISQRFPSLPRWASALSPFLIIVLSLVVALSWFRDGLIHGTAEEGLLFAHPGRSAALASTMWAAQVAPGTPAHGALPALPLLKALSWLNELGIPPVVLQAALAGLILATAALAVFGLVRRLLPETGHLGALLGSLFYLGSLFALYTFARAITAGMATLALLPLLLYLFLEGLVRHDWRFLIGMPLVSVIFSIAFLHPAFFIGPLILLASVASFLLLAPATPIAQRAFTLRASLAIFGLLLLANLFWLLPAFWGLTQNPHLVPEAAQVHETFRALARETPLSSTIRLAYGGLAGWYGQFYDSLVFQATSFLLPLLALLGAILYFKKQSGKLLALLALLGFFLARGAAPPFGGAFLWLVERIPLLGVFQNSFEKAGFLFLLPMAIMAAGALARLWQASSRLDKTGCLASRFLLALVVFLTLLPSWPLWTGQFFRQSHNDQRAEPPLAYEAVNHRLVEQGATRLLHLPLLPDHGTTLRWRYGYDGQEPSRHLFDIPSLAQTISDPNFDSLWRALAGRFQEIPPWKLAALFSASHLVIHDDVDWERRRLLSPAAVREAIKHSSQGLGTPLREPPLEIIPILPEFRLPLVRAVTVVHLVSPTLEVPFRFLIDTLQDSAFDPREAVLLRSDQIARVGLRSSDFNLGHPAPSISFSRRSPTTVSVNVRAAQGPFILVFAETFNPAWEGRVDGRKLAAHFPVNGYANGWYVTKRGDYEIVLEYTPQRIFEGAKAVSVLTVLVLSATLIWLWRRSTSSSSTTPR